MKDKFKLPVLGGTNSTRLLCSNLGIKEGMSVLVVSVNLRDSVIFLAKNYKCDVFGIHELPQIVMEAKGEVARAGLEDRVKVKLMNPISLDFDDETFDLVITEGVLSQYKKSQILRSIHRVSKNNSYLGIADFYWKSLPVPTYVKDVWHIEGGNIETLDEKIEILKSSRFEPVFVQDISDELRAYYSKFKKIIRRALREREFTKDEFKEVKKFKHEVSVYLEQGGDKWMGYVAIVAKKL